ncbi:MAG TPA: HAMP domain-containing protein [Anaerolineae bacterium]|nr:HAMP domain-containing protein [Anaerolineae bacterium]
MFRSLRIQLGAIVFCFVLLLAGSVAITYLIVQTQASGATLRALLLIQLVLLVAALLLLTWGYFFTRRRFARPLATLNRAAHRIAEGHLVEPVRVEGGDELADLARAFETMRADIAASRDELESRVAQRTRELASAFEFSQEIVSQLDLRHLLQSVTDHARTLTRAEAASLCLLDEGNTALVLSSTSGAKVPPPDMRQPVWLVPADQGTSSGRMVAVERVFIVGDSLFAETLSPLLASSRSIQVVGSAPTSEAAARLRGYCEKKNFL